jgi:hypothetical protein
LIKSKGLNGAQDPKIINMKINIMNIKTMNIEGFIKEIVLRDLIIIKAIKNIKIMTIN